MVLIKIKKTYRNGHIYHKMLLDIDENDVDFDEKVKDSVDSWAEYEGSGSTYGYDIDYEIDRDINHIKKEINYNIKLTHMRIEDKFIYLSKLKEELKKYN